MKLAFTSIFKLGYNHLFGDTNELNGGTNWYKQCWIRWRSENVNILILLFSIFQMSGTYILLGVKGLKWDAGIFSIFYNFHNFFEV